MQLGIFAKTFAGTSPHAVMQLASEAGFSCVQYNMSCSGLAAMPDVILDEQALAVATAANANALRCVAVSGTYNMIHPNPEVRATGLRRLHVLAEKSAAMGSRIITLCTGTRDAMDQWRRHADNDGAEAWRELMAEMEKAVAIAALHDVVLAVEPELANVVNTASKAKRLLSDLQSPHLKIVLDGANLFEREAHQEQIRIIADAIDCLGDDIVIAHAKDRRADGEFVAAGQGVLDYDHYLTRLKNVGFDGPLITHGLTELEAPEVARFLRRKLMVLGV